MENYKIGKDKESGRVIGGLILVAVGAALLLRNVGVYLPSWVFSWPMILILVGIYIGFKSDFRNNSWFIISLVGCYFLVSQFIPSLGLQPMFWPIVIIGLGITFILRPHKKSQYNIKAEGEYDKWENVHKGNLAQKEPNIAYTDTNDFLFIRSVFSGVNKNIVSKNFQGGSISCVFGGAEIDLSQADIQGEVRIKMEMVFGGAKLVIPPHWTVQNHIDGVFHAIDDKRSFNPSISVNPDKVLILNGSAVFGGLEIRSY